MGDFEGLVAGANAFFRDLSANNSRDWFQAHKGDYEAEVKGPAALVSDVLRGDLDRARGKTHSAKIFRINRDVRFSKDKRPYNTHLHLLWSREGDDRAGFFLGISPDYVTAGVGVMSFSKDGLDRYRRRVAGEDGADLADILNDLQKEGARRDAPALKRVPKPYAPDQPLADLLRHKGLVLWWDIADRADMALRAATNETFKKAFPFADWLDEI